MARKEEPGHTFWHPTRAQERAIVRQLRARNPYLEPPTPLKAPRRLSDSDDFPLPAWAGAYLAAFDRHLKGDETARDDMTLHLPSTMPEAA